MCSSSFRDHAPAYLSPQLIMPSITFLSSFIIIPDGCKLMALISCLSAFSLPPSFTSPYVYPSRPYLSESPPSPVIHPNIVSIQIPLFISLCPPPLQIIPLSSYVHPLSTSLSIHPAIHQLPFPPHLCSTPSYFQPDSPPSVPSDQYN